VWKHPAFEEDEGSRLLDSLGFEGEVEFKEISPFVSEFLHVIFKYNRESAALRSNQSSDIYYVNRWIGESAILNKIHKVRDKQGYVPIDLLNSILNRIREPHHPFIIVD